MPKVALTATLKAQPGKGQELLDVLNTLYDGALDAEPGTELHVLHRSKDDPDTVIFYELYSDQDAFNAHSNGEALKALYPKLMGLVAGRPEMVQCEVVNGKGISA